MGLTDKTVIVRTADHGEMGLTHGTLIQKNFNMWVARLRLPCVAPCACCCAAVVGSSVALVHAEHASGLAFVRLTGWWGGVVVAAPAQALDSASMPLPCGVLRGAKCCKAPASRHQPVLALPCHAPRRYEEATRIPLVFSNPKLWPKPRESEALVSHIDVSRQCGAGGCRGPVRQCVTPAAVQVAAAAPRT